MLWHYQLWRIVFTFARKCFRQKCKYFLGDETATSWTQGNSTNWTTYASTATISAEHMAVTTLISWRFHHLRYRIKLKISLCDTIFWQSIITSRHIGHSRNWATFCKHVVNFCSDWGFRLCKVKDIIINNSILHNLLMVSIWYIVPDNRINT